MRQVIVYATLLVALLLAAWVRWTAEPTPDAAGKVVLLAGDADQLDTIVWKGEDAEATVTRKTDDHGTYLWVEHSKWDERKLEGPPEVEADEDGSLGEAAVELPLATEKLERRTVFKASEKGDELLADFSPLYALRKLDSVDEDKLVEIGLDAPEETLVVTRKGKETTLLIGGEAYGTKDRYVREEASGAIYLVDDQVLKTLQYAKTRLPDRSLWSLGRADIATAVVLRGDAQLELTQKNADDDKKATWVRVGSDVEDEQLTTWVDKALKLKGTSYVDMDDEDAPTDLQARFSLKLVPSGKGLPETLEVLQDGDDGDFYGRSEHTRGLLKLLRAPTRAVVDDVDALVE